MYEAADNAFGDDGMFQTQNGRRKTRVREMLENYEFKFSLIFFWIVAAPLRFISHVLLESSKLRKPCSHPKSDYPFILHWLNPLYSPMTIVLQFYNFILQQGGRGWTFYVITNQQGGVYLTGIHIFAERFFSAVAISIDAFHADSSVGLGRCSRFATPALDRLSAKRL